MKGARWLLLPFSLLYGLVVMIRNWLYDAGFLKSVQFGTPIICVGNLDVGGAGKSPMTEYLVRLFKEHNKVATLSRGYGRKTQGYLTATATATATEVGDEPAQFKHKFPDVTVAVCEKRVDGLQQLTKDHNLVILDDAYQHRAVKPGFSVLLFDYNRIHEPNLLLPAGNLREPFSSRWRADILVVTKCPPNLSEEEQVKIDAYLEPLAFQTLFFTTIAYRPMQDLRGKEVKTELDADTQVFLLTGIANPKPLMEHVRGYTQNIVHHNYPDHHRFSLKNISKLAAEFRGSASRKKVIITTEKDAQRLGEPELHEVVQTLPILVMPVATQFLDDSGVQFDHLVKEYVREHRANYVIH